MDPFLRLELLKEFMNKWIDKYPWNWKFKSWVLFKYPDLIPGHAEYIKKEASHCFYCDAKLVDGTKDFESPRRASVDHYQPKSQGETDRFVICCADCNTKKGSISPANLVKKLTMASLRGRSEWGFSGKKLEHIATQVQIITNDILYNTGPEVYYIKKVK